MKTAIYIRNNSNLKSKITKLLTYFSNENQNYNKSEYVMYLDDYFLEHIFFERDGILSVTDKNKTNKTTLKEMGYNLLEIDDISIKENTTESMGNTQYELFSSYDKIEKGKRFKEYLKDKYNIVLHKNHILELGVIYYIENGHITTKLIGRHCDKNVTYIEDAILYYGEGSEQKIGIKESPEKFFDGKYISLNDLNSLGSRTLILDKLCKKIKDENHIGQSSLTMLQSSICDLKDRSDYNLLFEDKNIFSFIHKDSQLAEHLKNMNISLEEVEEFTEIKFKKYDSLLNRLDSTDVWKTAVYIIPIMGECIPLNKETEHLLNTKEKPIKKYKITFE